MASLLVSNVQVRCMKAANLLFKITLMRADTGDSRDGRFGSKVGQIGSKWDKSGAFSDQISVHFEI